MPTVIRDAGRDRKEVPEKILIKPGNAVKRLDKQTIKGQALTRTVLRLFSEHFGVVTVEYDEMFPIAVSTVLRLDHDHLLMLGLSPIAETLIRACITTSAPYDLVTALPAWKALQVFSLHLCVELPSNIPSFIINHRDLNLGFPPARGRTALVCLCIWMTD